MLAVVHFCKSVAVRLLGTLSVGLLVGHLVRGALGDSAGTLLLLFVVLNRFWKKIVSFFHLNGDFPQNLIFIMSKVH